VAINLQDRNRLGLILADGKEYRVEAFKDEKGDFQKVQKKKIEKKERG
jgi:hypothetical protein